MKKLLDNITVKKIYIVTMAGFLCSLLPILVLALFNYPSADDFSASDSVQAAWVTTYSLLEVIKAAWENTVYNYFEWSGVYASVFWTSLQPGIFGEKWYGVTTWITIILLVSSVFYLSHVIFNVYLKSNKYISGCIACLYLFMAIHCMPDGNEGLFWHAGVVNYTWAFAFFVFLIGLVLSLYMEKNKGKKYIKFTWAAVMAVLVGGGNYITALQGSIVMFLLSTAAIITGYVYLKKSPGEFIKENYLAVIPTFIIIIAFGVSVLAPGNKVRMGMSQGMSPIAAILYSFLYAVKIPLKEWMDWPIVLLFAISIPFIIFVVKRLDYRFQYPFIPAAAGLCLVAATFTPSLYAQAAFEDGRLHNTAFLIWLLVVYVILFYISGWFCHKKETGKRAEQEISENSRKWLVLLVSVFLVLGVLLVRKNTTIFVGTEALYSLLTGEAKQYKLENEERLKILYDTEVEHAVLQTFQAQPSLLIFQDITPFENEWINTAMAKYYHKESVKRE